MSQKQLIKTKVKLDLLIDIDMLLMVEKSIRGRIYHAIYRYAEANNNTCYTRKKFKTSIKSWISTEKST